MVADTALLLDQALDRGPDRAARGRPGDAARRRPRHLSVRHVVQRDRRRRLHRVRASRRPGSTGSSRSSRPTRRGSARGRSRPSCSTTTASGCARPAASTARRPAGRAAAGGSTPSIARYAARINGVTDFVLTKLDVLTGCDQVPVCVAYDVDGVRARRDADDADRLPPREAGLRALRRLDGGHLRRPLLRRPAGQRPGVRHARSRR